MFRRNLDKIYLIIYTFINDHFFDTTFNSWLFQEYIVFLKTLKSDKYGVTIIQVI